MKDKQTLFDITTNILNKIKEILNAISSANRYGEYCLSDGHGFEFKMYDDKKIIDSGKCNTHKMKNQAFLQI